MQDLQLLYADTSFTFISFIAWFNLVSRATLAISPYRSTPLPKGAKQSLAQDMSPSLWSERRDELFG